ISVIDNQLQKFIDWQYFVDYDSQMTEQFFAEYTGIKVTQFRETLLQHMGNVKKFVAKRAHHQRQYERRVNNRQMQTQESKIDMGSALDVVSSQELDSDLFVMESNGTESEMHDTSSSSGNYITHVVDANIRPVNDQVPFAEIQLTAQHNVLANEQQHTDQSEPIYDTYLLEKVDSNTSCVAKLLAKNEKLNKENEHLKQTYKELFNLRIHTKDHNDLLIAQADSKTVENADLKKLRSRKSHSSYVPKARESVFVKLHHVIASGSSRNSSNESYGSNDMAHKYYLEVHSHAKVHSPKTRNINKPVEPKSHTQKPDRQIAIGQRFSLNKSSAVREKPNTPRSCVRWIPTGRILKTVGLRYICQSKKRKDSENVQASDLNVNKMASADNTSGSTLQRKERCTLQCALSLEEEKSSYLRPFSSKSFMLFHDRSVIKLVQNLVSPIPYVPPSKKVYEILFQQLFNEYFNPPPRAVSLVLTVVAAPRVVDPADSPSSTTIDQDVPSASSSPTTQEIQSLVTHQVDIEKVAVCSSLRSLKPKCIIESRAKRSSENLIRTLFHYAYFFIHCENENGNPARANIKQALGRPLCINNASCIKSVDGQRRNKNTKSLPSFSSNSDIVNMGFGYDGVYDPQTTGGYGMNTVSPQVGRSSAAGTTSAARQQIWNWVYGNQFSTMPWLIPMFIRVWVSVVKRRFCFRICVYTVVTHCTLPVSVLTSATISASYVRNDTDFQALLSFKSMITQDPHGALTSWNDSFHFCDWSGVSCGKRHRRVTALYLGSQGFEGSLSPYVGNLSFLRELVLLNNSLDRTIPHELGRLSRLRLLVFQGNKFNGSISANLSSCFNLRELRLSRNELVGSIPKELRNLSFLRELVLVNNSLDGTIPHELGRLSRLRLLVFQGNKFNGSISANLSGCFNLRELRLSHNELVGSIPKELSFLLEAYPRS
nr:protein kinase-like domain-containing protein [Tanacetum cinerariifolium]